MVTGRSLRLALTGLKRVVHTWLRCVLVYAAQCDCCCCCMCLQASPGHRRPRWCSRCPRHLQQTRQRSRQRSISRCRSSSSSSDMCCSSSCDWKSSSRNRSKPNRRSGTGLVVALSASCVWLNRMALRCAAMCQANHGWRKLSSSRRNLGCCKLAHLKCFTWCLVLALRPSCVARCTLAANAVLAGHSCPYWLQPFWLAAAVVASSGCVAGRSCSCWLKLSAMVASAVFLLAADALVSSRCPCQQQMSLPMVYALSKGGCPYQQQLSLSSAAVCVSSTWPC